MFRAIFCRQALGWRLSRWRLIEIAGGAENQYPVKIDFLGVRQIGESSHDTGILAGSGIVLARSPTPVSDPILCPFAHHHSFPEAAGGKSRSLRYLRRLLGFGKSGVGVAHFFHFWSVIQNDILRVPDRPIDQSRIEPVQLLHVSRPRFLIRLRSFPWDHPSRPASWNFTTINFICDISIHDTIRPYRAAETASARIDPGDSGHEPIRFGEIETRIRT